MKVFISKHASRVSIPLRFGFLVNERMQRDADLVDSTYDEVGTKRQRQDEIDEGRRHYTGCLVIANPDNLSSPHKIRCRVVLGEPKSANMHPPVITLLKEDFSKGDMTVTMHIEKLLTKRKITEQQILDVLHPAYMAGEINDSTDVDDALRGLAVSTPIVDFGDETAKGLIKQKDIVIQTVESKEFDETTLNSPLTFKPLPIEGVKYDYVIADAYIENVRVEDDCIKFDCLNSKGEKQLMHSFKLSKRPWLTKLHEYALHYFEERDGGRATFAICMSDPCKGFIAESVTAISLQIMQNKGV